MSIRLTQSILIAGAHTPVDGATLILDAALEADLVNGNKAVYVTGAPVGGEVPVTATVDPVSGLKQLVLHGGAVQSIYDVRAYGAKCDGKIITGFQVDGTGNTGVVTSTADMFVEGDIGKRIIFHKAFSAVAGAMVDYPVYSGAITAYTDARTVTVAINSCPDLGASAVGAFGTDDLPAINSAIYALSLNPFGGVLEFPIGMTMAGRFKGNWSAGATYAAGLHRLPSTPNTYFYIALVGGVTGGVEPTWPTTYGATVTDGGVTWMCAGKTTIVLPTGSHMRGHGRQLAIPYGIPAKGSVLINSGYTTEDYFVKIANGCSVKHILIDAFKGCSGALRTTGTGAAPEIFDVSLMRGYGTTFANETGSAQISDSHIMGSYVPSATVSTGGDSSFSNCIIAGAGANFANVLAQNVTDDFALKGCHLYKGGWGIPGTDTPGPNVLLTTTAAGNSGGGVIAGNIFDTAFGAHLEINITGGTSLPIQALAITGNQFYQPGGGWPDNTYPVIKITASATAPATAIKALSITGNVGKGNSTVLRYKAFIETNLNAGTQMIGDVIANNSIQDCMALYVDSGAAHTEAYSAGNATTNVAVVTVG